MFKSDRFAQVATALVGALVLSTLSIGIAVSPVRATERGQSWIASSMDIQGAENRASA
jgi:hypothetical protein